jgi:histidinol-phosphate aminotransferase
MPARRSLIRRLIHDLHPYVPGEQPKVNGLVKLNTNENPYPPSSRVLRAIKAATDDRLRLYPNPTAQALREELAKLHRCTPENIIVGNGSDELLAMAVRCFVEPASKEVKSAQIAATLVQYFEPSYSLYPVLAEIHGARCNPVPLKANFDLPSVNALRQSHRWNFQAALTFVTTPNAPSGRGYTLEQLASLCRAQDGVVVLDEAYVDFGKSNALGLALEYPHVLAVRTFSKAYSLCFQRVGYFVGHPALIEALQKIRDSYNVNGLGQVAALATLDDLAYYRRNFQKIIATREKSTHDLKKLGFDVLPSQTNFILVRPPRFPAELWLQKLRDRKVLVRWFKDSNVRDYLRITIGTPAQAEALLRAVRHILRSSG